MNQLNVMMSDIREISDRYLKKERGMEYVYARLWEDYYDDTPDEEMIVYNLIIARNNILETTITDNNLKCIIRAVRNYENNQQKVRVFFSEKDYMNIQQMYKEIKFD